LSRVWDTLLPRPEIPIRPLKWKWGAARFPFRPLVIFIYLFGYTRLFVSGLTAPALCNLSRRSPITHRDEHPRQRLIGFHLHDPLTLFPGTPFKPQASHFSQACPLRTCPAPTSSSSHLQIVTHPLLSDRVPPPLSLSGFPDSMDPLLSGV